MSDKKKTIIQISIICCLVLIISSLAILFIIKKLSADTTPLSEIFNTDVIGEKITFTKDTEKDSAQETKEQGKRDKELYDKIGLYKDYNPDVIGWIRIQDTTIDLPIMYTPDDEGFYLRKDLDKKYNSYGLPFMAIKSNLDTPFGNILIYGHNITKYERAIFADISLYEDISFYKEHPFVEIASENGVYDYFIFAYLLVDNHDKDPFKYADTIDYTSLSDFNDYMNEIQMRNWIGTDYKPSYDKKTLILSSCSNELFGTGGNRMLLVAQKTDAVTDYDSYIENAFLADNPLLPDRLN